MTAETQTTDLIELAKEKGLPEDKIELLRKAKEEQEKREKLLKNLRALKFVESVDWEDGSNIISLQMERPIIRHSKEGASDEEVIENGGYIISVPVSAYPIHLMLDVRFFEEGSPHQQAMKLLLEAEDEDESARAQYYRINHLGAVRFYTSMGYSSETKAYHSYLSPHFQTTDDDIDGYNMLTHVCTYETAPVDALRRGDIYGFVLSMNHVLSKVSTFDNLGFPQKNGIPKSLLHYRQYNDEAEMKFTEAMIRGIRHSIDPDTIGFEHVGSKRAHRIRQREMQVYRAAQLEARRLRRMYRTQPAALVYYHRFNRRGFTNYS